MGDKQSDDSYPVPVDERGLRPVSPTHISRYISLGQCDRYLRLRLHQNVRGRAFLDAFDVRPQELPPLLTKSGNAFEARVYDAIAVQLPMRSFANAPGRTRSANDNAAVVDLAAAIKPGTVQILCQPRLHVALDGWWLSGDLDLLRLERTATGELRALIVDIKSSASVKVDHRLQTAFYHEMVAALLAEHGLDCTIETGIVYRGPASGIDELEAKEQARFERERVDARTTFGVDDVYLQRVAEQDGYLHVVRDMVTSERSTARRVIEAPFTDVPFHLNFTCDGCYYNEFCMKWAAERDDLSLLPHLGDDDKRALRRAGIETVREVAALKTLRPKNEPGAQFGELVPTPGQEERLRRVASAWPVGTRVDELIHRARRYRAFKGDDIERLPVIPNGGYGSLPYADATHNPNLVRVYIDAQYDYLNERVYLLGALVVGCEGGVPRSDRRRMVVRLTDGPPVTAEIEAALLVDWISETVRAIVDVAAPDVDGEATAPIHLIFFDRQEQQILLDALGRHGKTVLGATPLYDFMTQLAAFDSPIATFLNEEARDLKNYPMVCQSLQSVAAFLKFDWRSPEPYRDLFNKRMFDFWRKLDDPEDGASGESPWYTARARFSSHIPLEYAYAAWGELLPAARGETDHYRDFRHVTPDVLQRFHGRRLEALEHIAGDFQGNKRTEKRSFHLPDIGSFDDKARGLADALAEFLTIERLVYLNAWKRTRLAAPERRVMAGQTLIVGYHEADQEPEVAEINRENERRRQLKDEQSAAFRAANPDAAKVKLSKAEREESDWDQEGLRVRLRLETAGTDASIDETLALTTLKAGDSLVLSPRLMIDSRLPAAEQRPFQPTPRKMLYNPRATLVGTAIERDASGRASRAFIEVDLQGFRQSDSHGYAFISFPQPLIDGEIYTLDEDPNNWYGSWCAQTVDRLRAGEPNTLYQRLIGPSTVGANWTPAAAAAQARFLDGLDAFHAAGELHSFEEGKRQFIGGYGDELTLLVQGPPGTGKSYTAGFAAFARFQAAMAAGRDYRLALSCKTHAATTVLLENAIRVQRKLAELAELRPELFDRYFDRQLLTIPLYRLEPRDGTPPGAIPLVVDRTKGSPRPIDIIAGQRWCIVAATPGGIRKAIKQRWDNQLFGHELIDGLILDEASQMNLPEAVMAALPLKAAGHLIVVGDHRQMPPIVQHDWAGEPRRTFQDYKAYESLFRLLHDLQLPVIRFAESFRLHAEMAEFLRREIYHQDGIDYHSRKRERLAPIAHESPFVEAVLAPDHPLVVVVHDEAASQQQNTFERDLVAPVLEALNLSGYDVIQGFGVVVPHRAQRAALQDAVPQLVVRDSGTGAIVTTAVDTVERFQGGERTVVIVSATESDRSYLQATSAFLLDPRRLTVALSRAKQKMVLIASRSIFELFSADEEAFANARLWKNLLRTTCTVPLWADRVGGVPVEVWGNAPALTEKGAEAEPEVALTR